MRDERILCVDDDPFAQRLLRRILAGAGHDCVGAASVEEARHVLSRDGVALVLCDIGLPGSSGLELLRELADRSPDVATVMVTGRDDPDLAGRTIELGAYGYLTKPFATSALEIEVSNALHRRRLELERRDYEHSLERAVRGRTSDLQRAHDEVVLRFGRAIEAHDGDTGAHIERVGAYSEAIALALGLDDCGAALLRRAAPLHDIGKIAVPDRILLKPGSLTPEERAVMQRHTDVGHELLAGSGNDLLELAATIAWTHHERADGTGYPRGLHRVEIPLEGRIVAVADVFDALTSDRPYRPALAADVACAYLTVEARSAFDPVVLEAFETAVMAA